MKKLLKNKKVLVALTLVLVSAMIGGTFAWFTYSGAPGATEIQSGRLRVPAYRFIEWVGADDDGEDTGETVRVYYDSEGNVIDGMSGTPGVNDYWGEDWLNPEALVEPSLGGVVGIEVRNVNPDGLALPAIVKLDWNLNKIYIWSTLDENGNAVPLPAAEEYDSMEELAAAYPDVNVTDFDFDVRTAGMSHKVFYIGGEYVGMLLWNYDKTVYDATGEYVYYAALSALPEGHDLIVDFLADVGLAPEAGNRFQGSVADISFGHKATQALEDAVAALWGTSVNLQIASFDFDDVDINAGGGYTTQGFNPVTFDGPHVSKVEARRMTVEDFAKVFFPGLYK